MVSSGCRRCFPNGILDEAEDEGRAPAGRQWQWRELTPVYDAPHEIAAISIQAELEAAGIPAVVRSSFVPGYGGVAMTLSGCWGWVLVSPDDLSEARGIIEQYLLSLGVRSSAPVSDSSELLE
jgi:hypothetical protein